jgi:hypothetical protein
MRTLIHLGPIPRGHVTISCRFTVVSIRSWMLMSAVVRGMARAQLATEFPGPVKKQPPEQGN